MKGELARRINEMLEQPSLRGIIATGHSPKTPYPHNDSVMRHRHHRFANRQHKKHTFKNGEVAKTYFRWNVVKRDWDLI